MKLVNLKRIWKYVAKHRALLILIFCSAAVGNLLSLAGPMLTGKGIDYLIGPGQVKFLPLLRLIIILVLLYVVSSLFQWFMAATGNVVASRTVMELREEAFQKLNKLPLKYFDQHPHGDVISRLTNDVDAISDGLFQGITQIISGVVIIVGTFGFMLSISPLITFVVVFITPICFLIAWFLAKKSRAMFRENSKAIGELNGYAEEMISNQKVVRAFGYEEQAVSQFKEINERLYIWGQKSQWYSSLTNPTTRFVNNAAYVCVAVIGGMMAIAGRLSVGKISAFLTYSGQFAKPINEITSVATQLQSAIASAGRIFALLDEAEEKEVGYEQSEQQSYMGNLQFKHVDFSYQNDRPLIKNLNLDVLSGQTVAIVGPTGAGKSTLVNLLMRFYEVDSGEILLDGSNIKAMSRDNLRARFGMVLQESWLFHGTVAENISYGNPSASREEIIAAAKEAHAHSFIARLSDGYDTTIDEDGRNLSGGQKQLLTIARVLLLNPPILILDEATSSIDTRTEVKIQKAFHKMMKGKTCFIIAHRLATIQDADTILVMNYGQIVEQGNHQELLEKKGFYYKLYHSQFVTT